MKPSLQLHVNEAEFVELSMTGVQTALASHMLATSAEQVAITKILVTSTEYGQAVELAMLVTIAGFAIGIKCKSVSTHTAKLLIGVWIHTGTATSILSVTTCC